MEKWIKEILNKPTPKPITSSGIKVEEMVDKILRGEAECQQNKSGRTSM